MIRAILRELRDLAGFLYMIAVGLGLTFLGGAFVGPVMGCKTVAGLAP